MKRLLTTAIVWLVAAGAQASPWPDDCIGAISAGQTVSGQLTSSDCAWYMSGMRSTGPWHESQPTPLATWIEWSK